METVLFGIYLDKVTKVMCHFKQTDQAVLVLDNSILWELKIKERWTA